MRQNEEKAVLVTQERNSYVTEILVKKAFEQESSR